MKKILVLAGVVLSVTIAACGSDNSSQTSMTSEAVTINQASRANLLSAYKVVSGFTDGGRYPTEILVANIIKKGTGFDSKAGNLQNPARQLEKSKDTMVVFFSEGKNLEIGYAPLGSDFQPMYLHVFSGQAPIVNVYSPGSSKQTSK